MPDLLEILPLIRLSPSLLLEILVAAVFCGSPTTIRILFQLVGVCPSALGLEISL